MNLRALLVNSSDDQETVHEVLRGSGGMIELWLEAGETGLARGEGDRLLATVKRALGHADWFEATNEGHLRLLWTFCCDGNQDMLNYMLSLPGIRDPKMEDGTNSFAMALAQRSRSLVRSMLSSSLPSRADQEALARAAILELDKEKSDSGLKRELLSCCAASNRASRYLRRKILSRYSRGPLKCRDLRSMTVRFPFLNPSAESRWAFNRQLEEEMLGKYLVHDMKPYILGDLCLDTEGEGRGGLPEPRDCKHRGADSMNCLMATDLLDLASTLERDLQSGTLSGFGPKFKLVGSMAEGTRIGLANELDIGLTFEALKESVPFEVRRDPFSLKEATTSPDIMRDYFAKSHFQLHLFKHDLLVAVSASIKRIYDEGRNPLNLTRVTKNEDWECGVNTACEGSCRRRISGGRAAEQCDECAVTVSQTKIGAILK